MMYRPILMMTCISLAFVGSLSSAGYIPGPGEEQTSGKQEAKENKKSATASMTGCIDEQDGHYLLLDERTRDPIAHLEADGFETEGFAKHLGHKVTIRGTTSTGGAGPVFKVRSIEKVSEMCGAQ